MIFDTHAHYDDERFDPDREELLNAMPDDGVGHLVIPGTAMRDQARVLEIAAAYPFIHAAAGIHPNCPAPGDADALEGFLREAERHKIVAVGECGLDYYPAEGYVPPSREAQREAFDAQICLAERYRLPVIIHDRDAHADCLDILRAHKGLRAVFHCFTGSAGFAREAAEMGFYISFTGSVTYKKNEGLREAAAAVPDDLLLTETDAPYLAPEPLRGKRCDSRMIKHVIATLAAARGQPAELVEARTWGNALRFFGLPASTGL
ncbi:MAG: TatD family hydrolase [Oscillospiraceae bacterium]|jgi:TatD DNase family protein|nr:TatD family hydrolase [Oscillospiraceae bacterium]